MQLSKDPEENPPPRFRHSLGVNVHDGPNSWQHSQRGGCFSKGSRRSRRQCSSHMRIHRMKGISGMLPQYLPQHSEIGIRADFQYTAELCSLYKMHTEHFIQSIHMYYTHGRDERYVARQ
jgi:hypothetical protein